MDIVILHIETFWTKKSRGNPGATKRNSVPESCVAGEVLEINGVQVKEVKYSEYSNFVDPIISDYRSINENQQRQMGFQFDAVDDRLLVSKWKYSGRLSKVGYLDPESWLRVVTNERTPLEHTWGYHKHVYNIFFGNAANIDHILVSKSPLKIFNMEVNLW